MDEEMGELSITFDKNKQMFCFCVDMNEQLINEVLSFLVLDRKFNQSVKDYEQLQIENVVFKDIRRYALKRVLITELNKLNLNDTDYMGIFETSKIDYLINNKKWLFEVSDYISVSQIKKVFSCVLSCASASLLTKKYIEKQSVIKIIRTEAIL